MMQRDFGLKAVLTVMDFWVGRDNGWIKECGDRAREEDSENRRKS
jgi:hypothetical protein